MVDGRKFLVRRLRVAHQITITAVPDSSSRLLAAAKVELAMRPFDSEHDSNSESFLDVLGNMSLIKPRGGDQDCARKSSSFLSSHTIFRVDCVRWSPRVGSIIGSQRTCVAIG
jgi:hypothetical protein